MAIVKYKTKLKVPRRGVCTSYLASLKEGALSILTMYASYISCIVITGDILDIGIRKGYMELPEEISTPVICIGPGTGIAPMRALIGDRVFDGARGAFMKKNLLRKFDHKLKHRFSLQEIISTSGADPRLRTSTTPRSGKNSHKTSS